MWKVIIIEHRFRSFLAFAKKKKKNLLWRLHNPFTSAKPFLLSSSEERFDLRTKIFLPAAVCATSRTQVVRILNYTSTLEKTDWNLFLLITFVHSWARGVELSIRTTSVRSVCRFVAATITVVQFFETCTNWKLSFCRFIYRSYHLIHNFSTWNFWLPIKTTSSVEVR